MKQRTVIVTIDTIMELFKDYCGGDIPRDCKPIKLLIHPTSRKLAIEVESNEWPSNLKNSPEVGVKFVLKRFFGVGGKSVN